MPTSGAQLTIRFSSPTVDDSRRLTGPRDRAARAIRARAAADVCLVPFNASPPRVRVPTFAEFSKGNLLGLEAVLMIADKARKTRGGVV